MSECLECRGDGRDRYSDYLFECDHCGGTGQVYGPADEDEDELNPTPLPGISP